MPIPLLSPFVDSEKCIGCGACVGISPAVFGMKAVGKAEAKKGGADTQENIRSAINSCPTGAISLIKSMQNLPARS